jgi:small neutral amino acid transporter SnatA (MarC family)
MELNLSAFVFIITLAAVINALGIVRLLASFAEYLRHQSNLEIVHYWVFNLVVIVEYAGGGGIQLPNLSVSAQRSCPALPG